MLMIKLNNDKYILQIDIKLGENIAGNNMRGNLKPNITHKLFFRRILMKINQTMNSYRILLYLAVILFYIVHSNIIIRVRVADGSLKRLEIDEKHVQINNLLQLFKDNEFVSNENNNFLKINSKLLSDQELSVNYQSAEEFGLKSGSIIEIIEKIKSDSVNKTVKTIKSSSILKKKPSKKSGSISEFTKRRNELIKIKSHKPLKGQSVNISNKLIRVLNRISLNGGIAYLLGYQNTINKNSTKNKSSIEVLCAIELIDRIDNKNFLEKIDNNFINNIKIMAEGLGLSVIGVAINDKSNNNPINKNHIYYTINALNAINNNFIINNNSIILR